MQLARYFDLANRTISEKGTILNLEHARFGYRTEIGEAIDNLKRHVFYTKEGVTNVFKAVNFLEELGDIVWYCHCAFIEARKLSALDLDTFAHLEIISMKDEDSSEFSDILFNGEDTLDEDEIEENDEILYLEDELNRMLRLVTAEDCEGELTLANDIFCGVARICWALGVPLEPILQANIAKLVKRYAVKFSDVEAYIRDLSKEEEILTAAFGKYTKPILSRQGSSWEVFNPQYRAL